MDMDNRIRATLIALAASGMGSALAQDEQPIVTERPGFSSSPTAMNPGVFQIESGYLFVSDDAGSDIDLHAVPQIVLRYGVAGDMEVQFSWGGYAWAESGNSSVNGATDASIGMKWQVADGDAPVPLALFAGINLPVGASEFSSDEADPVVGAFWTYSHGLDWFGTVLFTNRDDVARLNNAIGINLPIDDRLGSFVEYQGVFGDRGPEHYLNGGLTWLPKPNLQWDTYLGLGLNDRAADVSFNLGLSYRYN